MRWHLACGALLAVIVAAVLLTTALLDSPSVVPTQVRGVKGASSTFANIPQDGTSLGSPRAPVVLIQYADLRCGLCGTYSARVLPRLVDRYVRPGMLLMEFRGIVTSRAGSELGTRLAAAASLQDRLWQFVHLYYLNRVRNHLFDRDFMERVADAVPGLDPERATADMFGSGWANFWVVDTDIELERRLRMLTDRTRVQAGFTPDDILHALNDPSLPAARSVPLFLIGRRGEKPRPLRYSRLTAAAPFERAVDQSLRAR